jgi:hypothetical protein
MAGLRWATARAVGVARTYMRSPAMHAKTLPDQSFIAGRMRGPTSDRQIEVEVEEDVAEVEQEGVGGVAGHRRVSAGVGRGTMAGREIVADRAREPCRLDAMLSKPCQVFICQFVLAPISEIGVTMSA